MSAETDAEQPETVATVLEAALDDEDPNLNLERVRRVAAGEEAYPAPRDYALAMQQTDGAVCVELELDAADRLLFRWTGDAFERFSQFQDREPLRETVSSTATLRWIGQYRRTLKLHSEVEHHFEQAQPAHSEYGQHHIGDSPNP